MSCARHGASRGYRCDACAELNALREARDSLRGMVESLAKERDEARVARNAAQLGLQQEREMTLTERQARERAEADLDAMGQSLQEEINERVMTESQAATLRAALETHKAYGVCDLPGEESALWERYERLRDAALSSTAGADLLAFARAAEPLLRGLEHDEDCPRLAFATSEDVCNCFMRYVDAALTLAPDWLKEGGG